ncbi:GNAT family N-acetyltransferase, partial [bacterium]|nr:GNAT family N-acetyltransferase [bacterium]
YKIQSEEVVHLDGLVVSTPLKLRGIGSALLEDFANRMVSQGVKVIKTHFFLRDFCSKRGFKVDRAWGGLVRFLDPNYGELNETEFSPVEPEQNSTEK